MLLNIGSGDHPARPPWINIDSYPGVYPHVIASVAALPFVDNCVDAVYCGHLLEHLTIDQGVPDALNEIRRVLRPNGRLCVVGPDYDRAGPDPVLLELIRDGGCRWPGDKHQWLSTGKQAVVLIQRTFPEAVCVPIETLDPFWPAVALVNWQFAITA